MLQKVYRIMFYAVKKGRRTGVYSTWAECEAQVKGFKEASYKKFNKEIDAQIFSGIKKEVCNEHEKEKSENVSLKDRFSEVDSYHVPANHKEIKASTNNFFKIESIPHQYCSISTQTIESSFSVDNKIVALERTVQVLKNQIKDLNSTLQDSKTQNVLKTEDAHFSSDKCFKTEPRLIKAKRNLTSGNAQKKMKTEESSHSKSSENSGKPSVYTDGACSANGKNGAAAGIGIYWGPNHPFNTSARLGGRQTNNRAEIQAAVMAIKQAKQQDFKELVLYTDSKFLINAITKWINGWKRNGWILTNGTDVKNKQDFQDLDEARKNISVEWVHVPGHSGILGNEEADRLAVSGIKLSPPK